MTPAELDDELAALLASWRADVDSVPLPPNLAIPALLDAWEAA